MKRYRVKHHRGRYFPQVRGLLFWREIPALHTPFGPVYYVYRSLEEALVPIKRVRDAEIEADHPTTYVEVLFPEAPPATGRG